MKAVDVDGRNITAFEEILESAAEHIGREWCRALLVLNDAEDTPYAGMCWELTGVDKDEDTRANILWCRVWNKEGEDLLFEEYHKRAQNDEVVSTAFELPVNEVQSAREALERYGFSPVEAEGQIVSVTLQEAQQLPFVRKGDIPFYVSCLSDRSERSLRRGIANCLYHGAKGILQDQASIPTKWFHLDVSTFVETDGRISGVFLIHEDPSGALVPQLLFAYGPDFQKEIMLMIRCSVRMAEMTYPSGTRILLTRHDSKTRALIGKLFPQHKGIEVIKGSRREQ